MKLKRRGRAHHRKRRNRKWGRRPNRVPPIRTVLGGILVCVGLCMLAAGATLVTPQLCEIPVGLARARVVREPGASTPGTSAGVSWQRVSETCPNAVAWLEVPGAGIDLPVMRPAPEDPGYYLTHSAGGLPSPAGAPFMPCESGPDNTHVVVYGHNLAGTGAMFSPLRTCHEQGEFVDVLAGGARWTTSVGTTSFHPLCASVVGSDDEEVQRTYFSDGGELREWLRSRVASSTAVAGDAQAWVATAQRALTLVTCSSTTPGQPTRTVVTFVT